MHVSLSLHHHPTHACVRVFIYSFIYLLNSEAETNIRRNLRPSPPSPPKRSLPLWRGRAGGGTKPTCRIPLFFAWKPWDSDPTPQMIFKNNISIHFLTSLGQFLRLAPEELSTSMMTAAQFLEGCHPYTCAASVWHVLISSGAKRKYLIFICLPMIWNDEESWSLRNKNAILWNFKMKIHYDSPLKFHF